MNASESRYTDKKAFLSRYATARSLTLHEEAGRLAPETVGDKKWEREFKEASHRFVQFLTRRCKLEFRGRILEIGAGNAWLSAELSKQPRVVEVITTDFSRALLKEEAPKVLKLLNANGAKITRVPADFHALDFSDNHFDVVISANVLHHASNIVQVLREAKRVLKPGGKFVAIREPVWPLVRLKSRRRMLQKLMKTGVDDRFYTLADYKEFFRQAAMPLEVERVNLSRGLKYYVDKLVNGLTHARYAFIGTKRANPVPRPTSSRNRTNRFRGA